MNFKYLSLLLLIVTSISGCFAMEDREFNKKQTMQQYSSADQFSMEVDKNYKINILQLPEDVMFVILEHLVDGIQDHKLLGQILSKFERVCISFRDLIAISKKGYIVKEKIYKIICNRIAAIGEFPVDLVRAITFDTELFDKLMSSHSDWTIKRILKADQEIFTLFDQNKYPTLLLAVKDRKAYFPILLELNNIDVNIQDQEGNTALSLAVHNNYNDAAQELLKSKNIKVNMKDNFGCAALRYAVLNLEITKALLKCANIDVNIQDNLGITPLIYAVQYANIYSLDVKSFIEELLKAKNVDVDIKNKEGKTALDYLDEKYSDQKEIADLIRNHKKNKEETDQDKLRQ